MTTRTAAAATIPTRPFARWLALLAATLIVLYLCWLMLQPFVDVLLWAAVLATVAYPAHRRLRRGGWSPSKAAMMTTILVVLVILIPLTLLSTAVFRQAAGTLNDLPGFVNRLLDPGSPTFQRIDRYVDLDPLRDPKVLANRLGAISGSIADRTLGLLGGLLGGVVQAFFVLFTLYYLLRDSDWIVPKFRDSLPLTCDQSDAIVQRTHEVIQASVNGVLVISAVQGLLGTIAFWILGVPSALLWGVVMFLLCTIPMAGSALVWGPVVVYLLIGGHWVKATILVAWGALVISTIDNVLRPRLVGKRANLHELIIFFSVLGGLQVFGVLGLFVGPVVAAVAMALVEVFRHTSMSAEAPAAATVVVVTEPPDSPQPPRPRETRASAEPARPAAPPGRSDGSGQ